MHPLALANKLFKPPSIRFPRAWFMYDYKDSIPKFKVMASNLDWKKVHSDNSNGFRDQHRNVEYLDEPNDRTLAVPAKSYQVPAKIF